MKEPKPKFTTRVEGPIDVNSAGNPDQIGRHYAALHGAECGDAYDQLGQKVTVRYVTTRLPDGTTRVEVVADHY